MAYRAPIDESKLVKELQNPKTAHAAFDLLVRTYGESLYWHIRRMVVNHDDANDILQNVFLKAWNNIHNFRGDAKLTTWMYKIAVNESLNHLGKERTRRSINSDEEGDDYLVENIEADEYFDGDQLHADLLKAVTSLPEKQRLVFNMKYFEDMKYEEISDILGTSVGSLKASYHHAVKKITEALSE